MLDGYNDLLAELESTSSLVWATQKDIKHRENERERTPSTLKHDVLNSDRLKHVIKSLCLENSKLKEDSVRHEAKLILDDMAHDYNETNLRFLGYMLIKFFKKTFKHIYYTKDLKTKLSPVCTKYPMLLLPNHRSYMDFLLLGLICYSSEIQNPTTVSGDNLKGLGFVSKFFRNAGAFFIKRTFGNDKLYWAIFNEYVQQQIIKRENPIEFYIEGINHNNKK
jgi:glycerone phosphate O-acyltransferase